MPFTTVAERLKPESLYDRFVAFRESLGMEVLPLTGGDAPPYDVLAGAARRPAGWSACSPTATCPRAASTSSSSATTARMPAGPAPLALSTGAALLPVGALVHRRTAGGIGFHPEVPIAGTGVGTGDRATQAVADAFADGIARTRTTGTCCSGSGSTTCDGRTDPRRSGRGARQ